MKQTIRLTESDLTNIIEDIINSEEMLDENFFNNVWNMVKGAGQRALGNISAAGQTVANGGKWLYNTVNNGGDILRQSGLAVAGKAYLNALSNASRMDPQNQALQQAVQQVQQAMQTVNNAIQQNKQQQQQINQQTAQNQQQIAQNRAQAKAAGNANMQKGALGMRADVNQAAANVMAAPMKAVNAMNNQAQQLQANANNYNQQAQQIAEAVDAILAKYLNQK